ncbi:MAG: hypothetical protein R3271_13485 [Methylophaga sp.]|uniref:hypothetical protein n=1 Tax=Methylophaga sp. TaxID=2024840 RepID=UPI00299EA3E6|nr:hypothetical protein [Methylophaga sp.]MDX1751322.1 hypothetical protein [Methylophaga sp.]
MKKLTICYRDLLHLFSMNKTLPIIFPIVLIASLNVNAEEAAEAIEDCGEAEIRYSDSPELTRAERIVLMEKAFFDSVNRFESCNLSDPNNTSADSSDGGDSGGQDGRENQDGNTGNNSVASQEMQGSEPETENSLPPQAGTEDSDEQSENEGGSAVPSGGADNGAIPEDIPSANNDDAIAAQIRLAAEAEQDPEIKKKLWNEYRKYKGMNIVED